MYKKLLDAAFYIYGLNRFLLNLRADEELINKLVLSSDRGYYERYAFFVRFDSQSME